MGDAVKSSAHVLQFVHVLFTQVIINYLVDQAEKKATMSRKKADQVRKKSQTHC